MPRVATIASREQPARVHGRLAVTSPSPVVSRNSVQQRMLLQTKPEGHGRLNDRSRFQLLDLPACRIPVPQPVVTCGSIQQAPALKGENLVPSDLGKLRARLFGLRLNLDTSADNPARRQARRGKHHEPFVIHIRQSNALRPRSPRTVLFWAEASSSRRTRWLVTLSDRGGIIGVTAIARYVVVRLAGIYRTTDNSGEISCLQAAPRAK